MPGVRAKSVYTQHLTHYSFIVSKVFPIRAFLLHLHSQIRKLKDEENQVILMHDIKEYIPRKKISAFFFSLGMRKLISDIHGD